MDDTTPLSAANMNNLETQYDEVKTGLLNNKIYNELAYMVRPASLTPVYENEYTSNDTETIVAAGTGVLVYIKSINVDFDGANYFQVDTEITQSGGTNTSTTVKIIDNATSQELSVKTSNNLQNTYEWRTHSIEATLTGTRTLEVWMSCAIAGNMKCRGLDVHKNSVRKVVW